MTVSLDPNRLPSRRFRSEREESWKRLDGLLTRIEKSSVEKVDAKELIAIPGLYRLAISSLSMARATILDQDLHDYLEDLCRRAYFIVYGVNEAWGLRARRFFQRQWSDAVWALRIEFAIAAILMALGFIAGWAMISRHPEAYYALMPSDMADGRDPSSSAATLANDLHGQDAIGGLSVFSTFLFTHNSQVAFLSFALGFAGCAPSAFLMIYYGAITGALMSIYARQGLALDLGGWLAIHGVTELTAICIAGAAGIRIGRAFLTPGRDTRLVALRKQGQIAGTAMIGVVLMLICAGLLEGLARQLIGNTPIRFMIAGVTLWFWSAYLFQAPAQRAANR